MFKDDERFSRKYPLNDKIKDTDVFLHGTSSKRVDSIKSKGFLLRNVDFARNFSISNSGICFEKYVTSGAHANPRTIDDIAIQNYCRNSCKKDGSLEGIVLQIKGSELKKLDCTIYIDWNKPIARTYDSLGRPNGVNYHTLFVSVIIVDKDIPIEYLEVKGRVPFTAEDLV